MIGDKVKLDGVWVVTTKEESKSSCSGCCFLKEDGNDSGCSLKSESSLECGNDDAIYKRIKVEKGIKRKLTIN